MVWLLDTTVEPVIMLHWMGGGVASFLLLAVVARIIEAMRIDHQQRTVTGLAVLGGMVISLGVSPFGPIATEIAQLFQVIPSQYPVWVTALVTVETALSLLFGLAIMAESGGWRAVASFLMALIGGLTMLYSPFVGFISITLGWLAMEASPVDRW